MIDQVLRPPMSDKLYYVKYDLESGKPKTGKGKNPLGPIGPSGDSAAQHIDQGR